MITVTNEHNLPLPVAEVIMARLAKDGQSTADRYKVATFNRGKAHRSVTEILDEPFQKQLAQDCMSNEHTPVVLDAASGYFAVFGTMVHKVLEEYCLKDPDRRHMELTARRLFVINGVDTVLHCTSDLVTVDDDGTASLYDYKVASVWEYMHGLRPEKREQLQFNAFLLNDDPQRGYIPPVRSVGNVLLFRDWSKTEAQRRSDYPQQPIMTVLHPVDDPADVFARILERLQMHSFPASGPCSPAGRWQQPTKYACRKTKNKRAARVLDTEAQAREWLHSEGVLAQPDDPIPEEWTIDVRPGKDVRCEPDVNGTSYCPVARYCPHGKQFFEAET